MDEDETELQAERICTFDVPFTHTASKTEKDQKSNSGHGTNTRLFLLATMLATYCIDLGD